MLQQCEARAFEREAALSAVPLLRSRASALVISLPSVVGGYLSGLRATMHTDMERARALLAKLIGPVTLRREEGYLVAEAEGNLQDLLDLDEDYGGNRGAGAREQSYTTDPWRLPWLPSPPQGALLSSNRHSFHKPPGTLACVCLQRGTIPLR